MKLSLTHSAADVEIVRAFCEAHRRKKLVEFRQQKNLAAAKPEMTKARFWRALVCMRLTSRQKSGPDSAVVRLAIAKPFPLALSQIPERHDSRASFIATKLKAIKGMRDYDVAAHQFAFNFGQLENGGWKEYLALCNALRTKRTAGEERLAANRIADNFKGFGPKQSRNFLQALGLTRYEIPLDSRVMRWLRNELKFPLPISGALLADREYYELILDMIQKLCAEATEYPCILDAAIFADADEDNWQPEMMDF